MNTRLIRDDADAEPRTEVSTSGVDRRERFWRSYLRVGFVICVVECIVSLLYLRLTPAGANRPLLAVLVSALAVLSIATFPVTAWVARRPWRASFALAWSLASGGTAAVCAHLDGGVDSPFLLLLVLPVIFAALGLDPPSTAACAAASLAELAAVGFSDPDVLMVRQELILVAVLLGTCGLAVAHSVFRTRQQADEDAAVDELHRLSHVDALTGCANYRAFRKRIDEELDRSLRYRRPLSLLVADVDLFKSFNDTRGHSEGDRALAAIGAALRTESRASDLVARIGGDEFAVLMPDTTAVAATEAGRRITELFRSGGVMPGLTLSIGAAGLDLGSPTAHKLFRDADEALYRAKANGRQRVEMSGAAVVSPTETAVGPAGYEDSRRMEERVRQAELESEEALILVDTLLSSAPVGFLLVDRDLRFVRVNEAAAAVNGVSVAGHLGRRVEDVVPLLWPQVEPIYRYVLERGEAMINLDVTGETAAGASSWIESFYPVRVRGTVIGVGVVLVDITERKRLEQAGADLTDAVVAALAAAAEARDPLTAGHQRRVGRIATAIGTELGLETFVVRGIRLAAEIHDVGKVAIPGEILTKPSALSDAELALVRTHAAVGYRILAGSTYPWPVAEMVGQHHERMDGSGYPAGLRGDDIIPGARVIAVADVIEATASRRPYRPALGLDAALSVVRDGRGRLFDRDVVDVALRLFDEGRLTIEGPAELSC